METPDVELGKQIMRLAKQQPGERLSFGNIECIRSKNECEIYEHGSEKRFGTVLFVNTGNGVEFPVFDFYKNEAGTLLTAETCRSIGEFLGILAEFQSCLRIGERQIAQETPTNTLVM